MRKLRGAGIWLTYGAVIGILAAGMVSVVVLLVMAVVVMVEGR